MGQVASADDITSGDCKFPPIAYNELTQKQRACHCILRNDHLKIREFRGSSRVRSTVISHRPSVEEKRWKSLRFFEEGRFFF